MKFELPEIKKVSFETENVALLSGVELEDPDFGIIASGDLA